VFPPTGGEPGASEAEGLKLALLGIGIMLVVGGLWVAWRSQRWETM
jgi:hypothetical protein